SHLAARSCRRSGRLGQSPRLTAGAASDQLTNRVPALATEAPPGSERALRAPRGVLGRGSELNALRDVAVVALRWILTAQRPMPVVDARRCVTREQVGETEAR